MKETTSMQDSVTQKINIIPNPLEKNIQFNISIASPEKKVVRGGQAKGVFSSRVTDGKTKAKQKQSEDEQQEARRPMTN